MIQALIISDVLIFTSGFWFGNMWIRYRKTPSKRGEQC